MPDRFLTFQVIADTRFGPASAEVLDQLAEHYARALAAIGLTLETSQAQPTHFEDQSSQWRISAQVPLRTDQDARRAVAACNRIRPAIYRTMNRPFLPAAELVDA